MSNIPALIEKLHDLSDPFEPVSERDIELFEAEIGSRLPEDYREFLLLHNGGKLRFHVVFDEFHVEQFYGLDKDRGLDDLRKNRKCFQGRVPDHLLMIGEGYVGYQCLLSLDPKDFGQVVLWNRKEETVVPFHKMAKQYNITFEGLLAGLRPYEDALADLRKEAEGMPEALRCVILYDLPGLLRHLANGGVIEGRDRYQSTPLNRAAQDWPYVVPLLLEYGAAIESEDRSGNSPLMSAVQGRSIDSVRALLAHGADPLHKNFKGITPLIASFIRNKLLIRRTLLRYLETKGVAVELEWIEKLANAEDTSEEHYGLDELVFFDQDWQRDIIDGASFYAWCHAHPKASLERGVYRESLATLIELIPKPRLFADHAPSLPVAHYEICARIVRKAGEHVFPQFRGVTLGDISSLVEKLYREVKRLTQKCATREEGIDAIPAAVEQDLFDRLAESFRDVCSIRYVPEAPVEKPQTRELPWIPASSAWLLSPPDYSQVTVENSGFVVSTGRMDENQPSEPRLDQLVSIYIPQVFGHDPEKLDGDPSNPVTYARYEVFQAIFQAAAERIEVRNLNATLADVGECIRRTYRVLVERSEDATSPEEVEAAISADVRQQLSNALYESLCHVCL